MKTEQDYEKEIAVRDAKIAVLALSVKNRMKKMITETFLKLKDCGVLTSEITEAALEAMEEFEEREWVIELERLEARRIAEDAEEAKYTSPAHKPASEEDQASAILDKDSADYLGKIDNHWS